MSNPVMSLLQTGISLKMAQLRGAVDTYISDRGNQGREIAVSYAVAAGLYAAAGVFVIALMFLGLFALFYWVESEYGTLHAFGACAGLLLLLALICAALAASKLRSSSKVTGLGSRLSDALSETPPSARADTDVAAKATKPKLARKTSPVAYASRPAITSSKRAISVGLIVSVGLTGWALARRYNLIR